MYPHDCVLRLGFAEVVKDGRHGPAPGSAGPPPRGRCLPASALFTLCPLKRSITGMAGVAGTGSQDRRIAGPHVLSQTSVAASAVFHQSDPANGYQILHYVNTSPPHPPCTMTSMTSALSQRQHASTHKRQQRRRAPALWTSRRYKSPGCGAELVAPSTVGLASLIQVAAMAPSPALTRSP